MPFGTRGLATSSSAAAPAVAAAAKEQPADKFAALKKFVKVHNLSHTAGVQDWDWGSACACVQDMRAAACMRYQWSAWCAALMAARRRVPVCVPCPRPRPTPPPPSCLTLIALHDPPRAHRPPSLPPTLPHHQVAAAVAAALGLTATPAMADAPMEWQMLPQDSASSTAQAQMDLHHDIMFFVIAILTSVFYMFFHVSSKRQAGGSSRRLYAVRARRGVGSTGGGFWQEDDEYDDDAGKARRG